MCEGTHGSGNYLQLQEGCLALRILCKLVARGHQLLQQLLWLPLVTHKGANLIRGLHITWELRQQDCRYRQMCTPEEQNLAAWCTKRTMIALGALWVKRGFKVNGSKSHPGIRLLISLLCDTQQLHDHDFRLREASWQR